MKTYLAACGALALLCAANAASAEAAAGIAASTARAGAAGANTSLAAAYPVSGAGQEAPEPDLPLIPESQSLALLGLSLAGIGVVRAVRQRRK